MMSPRRDSRLSLSVVDSADDLLQLQDEWNLLYEGVGTQHFFHSFAYCWHVWRSVGEKMGYKLHVIVGRQEGVLVLVWPLMIAGRVLRMLSSGTLEYRDLIVDKSAHADAWMNQAWEFVSKTPSVDLFHFQNLREPSNLQRLLSGRHRAKPVGGGWCPVIRLSRYDSWDSYALQLPRSMRSDQRRQWARTRDLIPDISFEIVEDPTQIDSMIDWIMDQKIRWLKAKALNANNFGSAEMRDLFKELSKSPRGRDGLVLARLSDAHTTISAGFGYRFRNEFLFHVFAYDTAWANLSPSRLFLEQLLRWCISEKIETFDFMPGLEPFKEVWADDLVRTDSYMGSLTRWGSFLLWWHSQHPASLRLRNLLKALHARIPGRLLRPIRSCLIRLSLLGVDAGTRPEPPRLSIYSNGDSSSEGSSDHTRS